MTQLADNVKIMLILQVTGKITKLLKDFYGIVICTSTVLPPPHLFKNLDKNLNDL